MHYEVKRRCITPWFEFVWMPAAARSDDTVFDPSDAAFER